MKKTPPLNLAGDNFMSLNELANVAEKERNSQWENQFFQALCQENINLVNSDPQYGPDGWPYIFVKTDVQAQEPTQNVLRWLSERGLGLVVNPDKALPDFVFSYGMIWNFRETGYFYIPKAQRPSQDAIEFSNKEIKTSGQPSTSFLPLYARKILREFLQQQGILAPKILMISFDGQQFDLAFSLESFGNPPNDEHHELCEAISWFLPPHYSILLTHEEGLAPFELL
jgi:hypothetical protein